ncbi:hypothetical protein PCE1_001635 [Barthelona sp. PCE]
MNESPPTSPFDDLSAFLSPEFKSSRKHGVNSVLNNRRETFVATTLNFGPSESEDDIASSINEEKEIPSIDDSFLKGSVGSPKSPVVQVASPAPINEPFSEENANVSFLHLQHYLDDLQQSVALMVSPTKKTEPQQMRPEYENEKSEEQIRSNSVEYDSMYSDILSRLSAIEESLETLHMESYLDTRAKLLQDAVFIKMLKVKLDQAGYEPKTSPVTRITDTESPQMIPSLRNLTEKLKNHRLRVSSL